VHDTVGNLWEWTTSKMVPYPYSLSKQAWVKKYSEDMHVLRGGAYFEPPYMNRVAVRKNGGFPDPEDGPPGDLTFDLSGFRLVRSISSL
jgi:formylglycine-generating enzyme required for sulfatase activity